MFERLEVRVLIDNRFENSFEKWFKNWCLPLTMESHAVANNPDLTGYTGYVPVTHIAMFKEVARRVTGVLSVFVPDLERREVQ